MMKRVKKPHNEHSRNENAPDEAVHESTVEAEAADTDSAPVDQAGVEEVQPEIAHVSKAEYDTLYDKYIRLLAEYDNYRKRSERDYSRLVETATERLMLEILPILDNLDRATEHRKNKTTLEEYVKGIAIIEDQLRLVLAHAGLEAIKTVGEPFDPAIHDAIMQIPAEDCEPGIITNEAEKGYTLSGKVIRHPKVVVSK